MDDQNLENDDGYVSGCEKDIENLEKILKKRCRELARDYVLEYTPYIYDYLFMNGYEVIAIILVTPHMDPVLHAKKVAIIQKEGCRVFEIDAATLQDSKKLEEFITTSCGLNDDVCSSFPREPCNLPFPNTVRIGPNSFMVPELRRRKDKLDAFGYIRVSNVWMMGCEPTVDEQLDGILKNYREHREEYNLKAIYYDFNMTGGDYHQLPGLMKLLADLQPRQKLIVSERSVLDRDRDNVFVFGKELEKKRLELIVADAVGSGVHKAHSEMKQTFAYVFRLRMNKNMMENASRYGIECDKEGKYASQDFDKVDVGMETVFDIVPYPKAYRYTPSPKLDEAMLDLTNAIYFSDTCFVIPEESNTEGPGVLAYSRVSTIYQVKTPSPRTQAGQIREYCRKRGYHLRATFYDLATSGGDIERQTALIELYHHLQPGEMFIAANLDRITRDSYGMIVLRKKLVEKGCSFTTLYL